MRNILLAASVLGAVSFAFYYGLDTYERGHRAMVRSQLINQGSQIVGARLAAQGDGETIDSLEDLVKFQRLDRIPAGWKAGQGFKHIEHPGLSTELCSAINKQANLSGPRTVVLDVRTPSREQTSKFGCIVSTLTMFYKF